jgi:anti-anti-sigma regulatory factor
MRLGQSIYQALALMVKGAQEIHRELRLGQAQPIVVHLVSLTGLAESDVN